MSEDLKTLEKGECGGPPLALSSGCLHCDQLGCGRGRQLLVPQSGEGVLTKQSFVLADVGSTEQTAAVLRSADCFIENVLHRVEVPTG